MSKLIDAVNEALEVTKGNEPAAAIWIQGHEYVPAARITALEEENKRLREALEPFASAESLCNREGVSIRDVIGMGDLRRAAAALEKK